MKLTEAACGHLPASLRNQLIFDYSAHHYIPDPRILDVLLQHWRRASLYYPSRRQQQQQQQLYLSGIDDVSVISQREMSLGVALAFINAVRFNTLPCLRTLHLTTLYTGKTFIYDTIRYAILTCARKLT